MIGFWFLVVAFLSLGVLVGWFLAELFGGGRK